MGQTRTETVRGGIARPYQTAAVLGGVAALASLAPIALFPPVTINLGSLVVMIAAIALGALPGALAATIGSIGVASQSNLGAILLTIASAYGIGLLTRRRVLPTMAALLFWLLATPVYALIAILALDTNAFQAGEVIVSAMVNGVLTVMAADLLLSLRVARRITGHLGIRRRRAPLRVLLFHGFMIISIVPLMSLGVVGGRAYASRLEADAARELHDEALSLSAAIDDYVLNRRRAVDALARMADLDTRAGTADRLPSLLAETRSSYDDFITLLATDAQGKITAVRRRATGTNKVIGLSVADRQYFTEPMKTGASFVSGVFRGRGLGNDPIVAISAPVHDRRGKVVGIVEGSLDPSRFAHFQTIASQIESGQLVVLDQAARVIFASDSGQYRTLQTVSASPLSTALRHAAATTQQSFVYDDRDEPMLAGVAQTAEHSWTIVLAQPLAIVRRQAEAYFLTVMAAMLGAVMLSFITASAFAGRVTKPLERLVAALHTFGSTGNPIETLTVSPESPREVETLAGDMQTITQRLAKSTMELGSAIVDKGAANVELSQLLARLDELVRERTRELAAATERAEDASRAKGRFLATMSHELRTPMNGVIGMLRAVARGSLSPEQRMQLGVAHESAESLLVILNDILDYSKIEAGKLELEVAVFELAIVAREVVDLLGERARQRGDTLTLDVAPELPQWVRGDRTRLRQVLLNLVDNAAKFTENGRVDVRLSLVGDASDDAFVLRVDIADTGIGMSSSEAARLFTPFTQADESTTRRFGGTGLGLAICRDLVGLMQGEIGVDSVQGVGSCFWFTCRLTRAVAVANPRSPTPRLSAAIPPSNDSFGTLLVVDDHPTNRMVAELTLRHLGFEVVAAASGQQALDILSRKAIDLVLMDCRMPEMDGFETTRRIRALAGDVSRTPIVALTAAAGRDDRQACADAGMDDFLSKPLVESDLRRVLSKWFEPLTPRSGVQPKPDVREETRVADIDVRLLMDLSQACGDAEAFAEVLDAFDETFATFVQTVAEADAANDFRAVEAAAHRMVGVALQVGAAKVAAEARAIEAGAKSRNGALVRDAVSRVGSNIAATRAALAAFGRSNGLESAA